MNKRFFIIPLMFCGVFCMAARQAAPQPPATGAGRGHGDGKSICTTPTEQHSVFAEIKYLGGIPRLTADGKPILLLCGELHNSTSSTCESLEAAMKTLKAMKLNSVVTTLTWEQLEPEEGKFDYTVADYTVRLARQYGMRIVLAWFGTWKNGESSYVPMWVKRNTGKYFHAKKADGTNSSIISPFCKEACKADAKAFAMLMKHIRETDSLGLVSAVQVENEVGVFMDMDHGKEAAKALASNVPQTLMDYMQAHKAQLTERLHRRWKENGYRNKGTWTEVFGDNFDTRQFMMSYAYATYLEEVTRAGKNAHPLPMYANCWLADDDESPGRWPCGGPEPKVLDIYKAFAPSLDWLSPDIYDKDFRATCQAYHRADNPLFIPETNREMGPAYYAFAQHDAIGYSPFAIEDTYNDPYLLGECNTLAELLPTISEYQGTKRMHGFFRQKTDAPNDSVELAMGNYLLRVHYIAGEKHAHGLIVQTADDEFLVAGTGCYITPRAADGKLECRLGYAEEVERKNGEWHTRLVLNGDQTAHHSMLYVRGRMPNADFDELGFHIPAPWTDVSSQRMYWKDWQNRYKVSGIYRIKLYTYPR